MELNSRLTRRVAGRSFCPRLALRKIPLATLWRPHPSLRALPLQIEMPNVITRKLTLPGIGIECYLNMWMDGNARTTYATFDIMLGTTSCDLTAGVLIKSQ
jgi:hypothetical protein